MTDRFNNFVNKEIFVILKNGLKYSGLVLSIDDSRSPVQFMNMKDKFGDIVCFNIEEIELIKEVKKNEKP